MTIIKQFLNSISNKYILFAFESWTLSYFIKCFSCSLSTCRSLLFQYFASNPSNTSSINISTTFKLVGYIYISAATTLLLISCSAGKQNVTNYYSAATGFYYQIQNSDTDNNNATTYTLSIVSASGSVANGITLVPSTNGTYTFSIPYGTGQLFMSNGNLSIANNGSTTLDFASSTPSSQILDGTYYTLCEYPTPVPCVITVNNNAVSIMPESSATPLCSNAAITTPPGIINTYAHNFSCNGTWSIVPFTSNGVTALMIAEPNSTATTTPYQFTSELAFPIDDTSINPSPNGMYNYAYNQIPNTSDIPGIESTTFVPGGSNGITVSNAITTSGNPAQLIRGAYYNNGTPINESGFDYYINTNLNAYNLIGNDTMALYQDSYMGFYLPESGT